MRTSIAHSPANRLQVRLKDQILVVSYTLDTKPETGHQSHSAIAGLFKTQLHKLLKADPRTFSLGALVAGSLLTPR